MILIVPSLTLLFLLFLRGLRVVPQDQVWVVQRLGKFTRKLGPGLNWTIPFVEDVAYRHSLKEEAIDVPEQMAITQDNVSVTLDGIVYVKITDPIAASYGVKNPIHALTQLVQTTMRSEVGKIPLDKTFEEREALNAKIVDAINDASISWGVTCIRYEIRDIKMPEDIRKAMELQMTAERHKRARILESEAERQAQINIAEGMREKVVLESEAAQIDRVNRAKGDAEAIEAIAQATARSIDLVASALSQSGGERAASLQIAEKYIAAFSELAKEGTTVLLPSNLQNPGSMIAEAMGIYDGLKRKASSPYSPTESNLLAERT